MSSKVTGDARSDAEPGFNHILPTEIVENAAGAGALTVAENTEPTAESASTPASTPASTTESAPDDPAEVAAGTKSADSTQSDELAEAETQADIPADRSPEAGAEAAPEETETLAAPTEPIVMTEPVELAEPVEDPVPRRRSHGVLFAFAFVVAALAIVGGAFAIVGSLTHGFKKPVIIHYKKSAIFSLKTGECIDPNGQTASVVSCTSPHDAEVFATFPLQGSKWPGATAVRTAASSGCATRLTGYLNPQLAISLASTYIYPDMVAWQTGTRTVICEVGATSGQLTGSVRGASATAS